MRFFSLARIARDKMNWRTFQQKIPFGSDDENMGLPSDEETKHEAVCLLSTLFKFQFIVKVKTLKLKTLKGGKGRKINIRS